MGKLFKLLSLLKLVRELRYTLRSRRGHGHGGYGPDYGHGGYGHGGYGHQGGHWHPRSRDYPPFYGRRRKPKLKHLVRDLMAGRRY